jgi:hypothetical protein
VWHSEKSFALYEQKMVKNYLGMRLCREIDVNIGNEYTKR